jgi:hypothetical protein
MGIFSGEVLMLAPTFQNRNCMEIQRRIIAYQNQQIKTESSLRF